MHQGISLKKSYHSASIHRLKNFPTIISGGLIIQLKEL